MLKTCNQVMTYFHSGAPANSLAAVRLYTNGRQDVHSQSESADQPSLSPLDVPYYTSNKQLDMQQNQYQLFNKETRQKLERLRQLHFRPTNIPDSPDFGTNQHIHIDEALKEQLKSVIATFNAPIRYAFAFGSAVFKQPSYSSKYIPMMDFIFGVSHPRHWHALNMQQNPRHYSAIRFLGSSTASLVQEKIGAGVYFNPYVEINGMMVKYGVVSIDALCKDLIDWDWLYVAGRMHKPVKILRDDARVRLANQVNLTQAVRVALLSLPEHFSELEFFERIAGISYIGDFRMTVREGPNKVRDIVNTQLENFHRLYFDLLNDLPNVTTLNNGRLQQNLNPRIRGLMVQKLPSTLYKKVVDEYRMYSLHHKITIPDDVVELHQQMASSPALPKHINTAIRGIIARPALTQSIKGIFTAGPRKTPYYTLEKLRKWQSAKK